MWFCQFPAFIFFCDTFFLLPYFLFWAQTAWWIRSAFFSSIRSSVWLQIWRIWKLSSELRGTFSTNKKLWGVCLHDQAMFYTWWNNISYQSLRLHHASYGVFALSNPVDSLCFITIHSINILQLYIRSTKFVS